MQDYQHPMGMDGVEKPRELMHEFAMHLEGCGEVRIRVWQHMETGSHSCTVSHHVLPHGNPGDVNRPAWIKGESRDDALRGCVRAILEEFEAAKEAGKPSPSWLRRNSAF